MRHASAEHRIRALEVGSIGDPQHRSTGETSPPGAPRESRTTRRHVSRLNRRAAAQLLAAGLVVVLATAAVVSSQLAMDTATAPPSRTGADRSGTPSGGLSSSATEAPLPTGSATAVMLAVGDLADCSSPRHRTLADLVASLDGTVALLGDIAYPNGDAATFSRCVAPVWDGLTDRLRPVPGNHEYESDSAIPYFDYFGPLAGSPSQPWYAYDLGAWRIYALNSNCGSVGGCGRTSTQVAWLAADLAARPRHCVLAYWHEPRFSSGRHGNAEKMADIWSVLDGAGADVVLAGHDHTYERFAPLDSNGRLRADGIRSFVVGTGGQSHYAFGTPQAGSEVRDNRHDGVLRLVLGSDGYAWRFIAPDGLTEVDSGSAACSHG